MELTRLGRSGLRVSPLCLGTMNFGRVIDETESHKVLSAAADVGINFVGTANVYGWHEYRGRSEEILGSWFAESPSRRDATVLASKVYQAMSEDDVDAGLSARNIVRASTWSIT